MSNTPPEHEHELRHRAANESESTYDRGLVVMLWLLAALIAEVELWMWVFSHMYGQ